MHKYEVIPLAGAAFASDVQVATDAIEHARRGGNRVAWLTALHIDAATYTKSYSHIIQNFTVIPYRPLVVRLVAYGGHTLFA